MTEFAADSRPHSRACGIWIHNHGSACAKDCPTCHGTPETKTEDPLTTHEATKRVLFHVVNTYQTWRNEPALRVPNEFTDDAVRIGEQHLRLIDWFPEDEGWQAHGENLYPTDGTKVPATDVLALIDEELARLRDPNFEKNSMSRKSVRRGMIAAREVAAGQLQQIRDAYVTEALTRETEAMRLYGVPDSDVHAD